MAAVLALTPVPLSAQETAPVPDPVADPPAESAAPAPDPLAPEPVAETPAEPVAEEAAPAPAPTRRAQAAPRATARQARAPAPQATIPEAPPTEIAAAEPVAVPQPAPATVAPVAEPKPAFDIAGLDDVQLTDEQLAMAGAAGLGVLALAGLGIAVRRRRRRREEQQWMDAAETQALQPVNQEEPAFVRAPQPTRPVVATIQTGRDVPRTKLPNGFDLSRFGPHVRAAYLGPTPDNPSLSLKYRLRRAAAMDQRARQAARTAPKPAPAVAPRPAPQQWNGSFMLRPERQLTPRPVHSK